MTEHTGIEHTVTEHDVKPPWKAANQHERDWMKEWVIAKLNEQDAEQDMRHYEVDATRDYYAPLPAEEQERLWFKETIRRARGGDVRRLRKLLDDALRHFDADIVADIVADFIQPPNTRIQGRRRSYPKQVYKYYWAEMIVDDREQVWALWKADYKGKWKRRGLRPKVEEIIAERRGLTENKVKAAIKLLSR